METNNKASFPLGLILFLIFLVLKLTNNIDWSWWWVTAPLWLPILVTIVILGIFVLVGYLINKK